MWCMHSHHLILFICIICKIFFFSFTHFSWKVIIKEKIWRIIQELWQQSKYLNVGHWVLFFKIEIFAFQQHTTMSYFLQLLFLYLYTMSDCGAILPFVSSFVFTFFLSSNICLEETDWAAGTAATASCNLYYNNNISRVLLLLFYFFIIFWT